MCGASSCPDAPGERALREVSASRPRGPQGLLPSFPVPVCAPACYGDRTLESDGARAPSALLAAPPPGIAHPWSDREAGEKAHGCRKG